MSRAAKATSGTSLCFHSRWGWKASCLALALRTRRDGSATPHNQPYSKLITVVNVITRSRKATKQQQHNNNIHVQQSTLPLGNADCFHLGHFPRELGRQESCRQPRALLVPGQPEAAPRAKLYLGSQDQGTLVGMRRKLPCRAHPLPRWILYGSWGRVGWDGMGSHPTPWDGMVPVSEKFLI